MKFNLQSHTFKFDVVVSRIKRKKCHPSNNYKYKSLARILLPIQIEIITVTGLGTAATTIPIVGCGESRAGLPHGIPVLAQGVATPSALRP